MFRIWQSIYFDANDPNYPALGTLFKLLIAVQNRLMRHANRSAAISWLDSHPSHLTRMRSILSNIFQTRIPLRSDTKW